MNRLLNLFSRRTLSALWNTGHRFPVPVLCAAVCTFWIILDIYKVNLFGISAPQEPLSNICGLGIFAASAATLLSESRNWHRLAGIVMGLILIGLITSGFISSFTPDIVFADPSKLKFLNFLGPGLILLCMVAPFIRQDSSNDAFWIFAYKFWRAVGIGLLGGAMFGGGMSAFGSALDQLLGIEVAEEFYGTVWILGLALFWPLIALTLLPRTFVEEFADGPPAWLRPTAAYLLIPLSGAYLVLIYIYAVIALLNWELSGERVAAVTSGFIGFSVATFLISYPWRDAGIRWLNLFRRTLFPVLAVPLILLATVATVHIEKYGVTEGRYLQVVVIVWLLFSISVFALMREKLVVFPAILGILLVLSSFGPWGGVAVSTQSQVGRLEMLLTQHGRLDNGHIVVSEGKIPDAAKIQINHILSYLRWTGKLGAITPWFTDIEGDISSNATYEELLRQLSMEIDSSKYFHIAISSSWFPLTGFDWASLHAFSTKTNSDGLKFFSQTLDKTSPHTGTLPYTVSVGSNAYELSVIAKDGRKITFDLAPMVETALIAGYGEETEPDEKLNVIMSSEAQEGALRVRLVIQQVGGSRTTSGLNIDYAKVMVMLAEQEP